MGLVQRIFYFHVPVGDDDVRLGVRLRHRERDLLFARPPLADHLALAAAELAVVFGLIVLVTGPLWARKAWGVWWQWEARLTTTLIMWMIFVAYLLLRRFGGAGSDRSRPPWPVRHGARAVRLLVGQRLAHAAPEDDAWSTLPPDMRGPFWFCFIAFMLL